MGHVEAPLRLVILADHSFSASLDLAAGIVEVEERVGLGAREPLHFRDSDYVVETADDGQYHRVAHEFVNCCCIGPLAQIAKVAAHRFECGTEPLEERAVAGREHDAGRRERHVRPHEDRRVHERVPCVGQAARALDDALGQDGRVIDDGRLGGDPGKRRFDDGIDADVVVQAEMDAVRARRRLGGIDEGLRAVLLERSRLLRRAIPESHGDTAAEHRSHHARAESAGPVECDRLHRGHARRRARRFSAATSAAAANA